MGILTKMLGTKIFLLLSLSVLGHSVPQPELRIIIHLHDFQPQPSHVGNTLEWGEDYNDDEAETLDEDAIPNEDVIPNNNVIPNEDVKPNEDVIPNKDEILNGEVELDGENEKEEEGSGSGSGETKVAEAGLDYHDHWTPQHYQGSYDAAWSWLGSDYNQNYWNQNVKPRFWGLRK